MKQGRVQPNLHSQYRTRQLRDFNGEKETASGTTWKINNGELQIIPDTVQPDCVMIMMREGRIDPNVCVKNDLFVVTVTHYILHIVNEYTMTFHKHSIHDQTTPHA